MSNFGIAGIQLTASEGDNLDAMAHQIRVVARRFPWVEMIVFGELCALGPDSAQAQSLPGSTEDRFCTLAQEHGLWLLPGTLFERYDDRVFNTAPVIAPDGQVVTRYRKIYPFCPYETGVSAGEDCVTFQVPDVGVFGVSICYDAWFPETSRTLAWKGAEVILHPTLTNTPDRDCELSIGRATAMMNQCYFIDVNSAGDLAFGRSMLVGPEGDVIHQAGSGFEIMPMRIDFERLRRSRRDGLLGLGQPLKSFRDGPQSFPPYVSGPASSPALRELGPLAMPQRQKETKNLDDPAPATE